MKYRMMYQSNDFEKSDKTRFKFEFLIERDECDLNFNGEKTCNDLFIEEFNDE